MRDIVNSDEICKECPVTHYSFPGSMMEDFCIERPECMSDDILEVYGDCVNDRRSITY